MKKTLLILLMVVLNLASPSFAAVISNEAKLEYNKGVTFYNSGQYENALVAFRKAIDISPDYIDAYFNLGTILEYLEQDDAALSVFKQIIIRTPNDYDALYKAALISSRLGKNSEAKMYLDLIPQGAQQYGVASALAKQMSTNKNPSNKLVQSPDVTPPKASDVINANLGSFLYENISAPTGMVTDSSGNLYIAGFIDNSITKILPNGDRILFAKGQKLNGPIGMVIDGYGNLYVANYNSDNILKITKNGDMTILIGNVKKPYCLYLNGKMLYASLQGANSVLRYRLLD